MQQMRLNLLGDISWDLVTFSYAPRSLKNFNTQYKRYLQFCTEFTLTPFPVTQWQLVRFATYLSFFMKSPASIINYTAGVCVINKINGFGKVPKGTLFRKAMTGIKRKLQRQVKQAMPMTTAILHRIRRIVDISVPKQLGCWVILLFGFHLFLRKSNLVPDSKLYDPFKHLLRRDFRIADDILLVLIKWSKTIQYAQRKLLLPIA